MGWLESDSELTGSLSVSNADWFREALVTLSKGQGKTSQSQLDPGA